MLSSYVAGFSYLPVRGWIASSTQELSARIPAAAANTLYEHLTEIKKDPNYYDLILTGDLGKYGKKIFIDTLKELYNIELNNYEDTACIIYDNDDKSCEDLVSTFKKGIARYVDFGPMKWGEQ